MGSNTLTWGWLTASVGAVVLSMAPVSAQTWTNVTGSLAYKLSECGTLTLVSAVPDSDAVIAGVAARGLWVNTSGTTWTRLTDPESDRVANRPTWIVYDPANPAVFWESGIYGPGIYSTTDGGRTFVRLGDITHNDYVSVDLSDPERRTLLAGGHEQDRTIHMSTDGGKTWRNVGRGLPVGSQSSHPFALDAVTFLIGIGVPPESKLNGIYRSTDAGNSWRRVATYGAFGSPLRTPTGVIYWSAPNWLLRSVDQGATWTATKIDGLRAIPPVELADRRLVVVGESHLLISSPDRSAWTPLGRPLPYPPDGLAYSPKRKALFVWRGDCREHVAPDAVMQLSLDVPDSGR